MTWELLNTNYLQNHNVKSILDPCCGKSAWKKNGDKFREIRNSKEYREKLSKGNSGKIRSEENKRKISESVKLLHNNPEYRELFLKRCRENAEKRKGAKAYTIDGKHKWILAGDKVPEGAKEGWV